MNVDFAILHVGLETGQGQRRQISGDFIEADQSTIDRFLSGVLSSGQAVLMSEMDDESGTVQSLQSVIAVPLEGQDDQAFGVVLAGDSDFHKFTNRHLTLLQTLAGQLGLVLQYAELSADIKFYSIMSERRRLAREIHEGLAQTPGSLKLQTALMENQLALNDTIRLQDSRSTMHKILSEAYLDVQSGDRRLAD